MVQTLQGIHTFKRDRNTEVTRCSPWGTEVKPFPSLHRKMKSTSGKSKPLLPNTNLHLHPKEPKPPPSPGADPKVSPMRRPSKEKLPKPRKVNIGFHHSFRQEYWLAKVKAKEAETTKQAPIPDQLAKALHQSSVTQSSDIQSPKNCAIYTPTGNFCPNEYPIPITADWPDSEEKKESPEQNKNNENFSDIKDWDGDLEKQQNNKNQTPQPHPKSTSHTETLTPQPSKPIIDRHGNPISKSPTSEKGKKEDTSEDLLDDIM